MPAVVAVWQGTDVRIAFTTQDATGARFDASAISIVIEAPDGSKATQTLAGGAVTRVSLGSYYFTVRAAQASDPATGAGYVCMITSTVATYQRTEPARFAVSKDPTS